MEICNPNYPLFSTWIRAWTEPEARGIWQPKNLPLICKFVEITGKIHQKMAHLQYWQTPALCVTNKQSANK